MAFRPASVRTWHRRLALVLGIFLIFQGVSGAVTQYRFLLIGETQEGYSAPVEGNPATPDEVIDIVKRDLPDFQSAHVMYPSDSAPGTAVMVMGGYDKTKMDMSRMVTVDQYRDKVLADMPMMESTGWPGLITTLHKWEWSPIGRVLITIIGFASMAICILGMWHYWQTRKVKPKSLLVRLHRQAGLFVGVVIFITAITGTAMNLFNWYEKESGVLVTATNMREAMMLEEVPPIKVDLAEASQIALRASGAERFGAFAAAGPHARQHWFAMTTPQLRRIDVLVDPQTGAATIKNTGLMEGGDGIRNWLYPLHTLYVVGELGGIIATICGIALLFWGVSGFLIWRRGRRLRKSQAT